MSQQGKEENFNENAESFECFDLEEIKSSIQNNNNKFQSDKRKYSQSEIINQEKDRNKHKRP